MWFTKRWLWIGPKSRWFRWSLINALIRWSSLAKTTSCTLFLLTIFNQSILQSVLLATIWFALPVDNALIWIWTVCKTASFLIECVFDSQIFSLDLASNLMFWRFSRNLINALISFPCPAKSPSLRLTSVTSDNQSTYNSMSLSHVFGLLFLCDYCINQNVIDSLNCWFFVDLVCDYQRFHHKLTRKVADFVGAWIMH